ncbi:MAG: 4'-phosphopantetheinyl transferase superfamily protein [Blautia sp.]|nr:4'-phosphopantetheinyl transferase superfamily protein [Blautia sp.]
MCDRIDNTRVYVADISQLKDPELFRVLYERLPEFRRRKADEVKPDISKIQSVGAGTLLMFALKENGLREKEPVVLYGENRKPYLRDYPKLHFNLSHAGDRVMCAISSAEVGCDVEEIKKPNMKIAKRFFTEDELLQIMEIQRMPSNQYPFPDPFYRIWTVKESVMKVTGKGMTLSMASFSYDLFRQKLSKQPDQNTYFIKEYLGILEGESYCYSCCSPRNAFAERPIIVALH